MTINGEVLRGESTDDGTPGRLTLETGFSKDALELPWANNERGRSCVNADTYHAILYKSDHLGSPNHKVVTRDDGTKFDLFHMVYRLEDKHGRQACEIHNANFAGEVKIGRETQLHGCTAVGSGFGKLMNDKHEMQMAILNSVASLEALIFETKGEDLDITYRWADGCEPDDLTDSLEPQ